MRTSSQEPLDQNRISITELRNDIYSIVDSVIETGVPVIINRKGKQAKIIVTEESKPSRLASLETHYSINCTDEELLESTFDMETEWDEPNKLK
jgi:prevent-host-death family protein